MRALARLPADQAKRIKAKIEQYAADPQSQKNNVKRLVGSPYFRLRVGDWRVIVGVRAGMLEVLKIGPRGNIYE